MTAYNKNVPRERGHGSRPIEGREILEIPLKEGTVMKKNFLNYLVKACAAYEYSMGWDVAYMRYEKGCWEQCGKHDEKTGPRFGRSIIRKLTPADKVVFRRVLFYNKLTNDSGSREDSIVMIGLKSGTVKLVQHQEEWHENAENVISVLKQLLGDTALDIQHVGSTAICSIHAKPIIDIAVAVHDIKDILPYIEELLQEKYFL